MGAPGARFHSTGISSSDAHTSAKRHAVIQPIPCTAAHEPFAHADHVADVEPPLIPGIAHAEPVASPGSPETSPTTVPTGGQGLG